MQGASAKVEARISQHGCGSLFQAKGNGDFGTCQRQGTIQILRKQTGWVDG